MLCLCLRGYFYPEGPCQALLKESASWPEMWVASNEDRGWNPQFSLALHLEVRAWGSDLLWAAKSDWGLFNWKKSLICW